MINTIAKTIIGSILIVIFTASATTLPRLIPIKNLFTSIYPLPNILAQSPQALSTPPSNWYMAGANAQRTSWVAEEIDPKGFDLSSVIWYRPIEAYIGQHTQLVTGYGNIYISTARGLYALAADTGQTVWAYDTEIPLGHSPTVINNTVYVGGFDHKIHALDASTGVVRWIFDGAQAGFSTSPLVIDGKVLMGNRDGYFYSIDATSGDLLWRYPSAGLAPLGPIFYSAAYKDGVVYFASNDNYAYALDVDSGNLRWKSAKLPGDGYHSWWPVIYQDYVIYSASVGYRGGHKIGQDSIVDTIPENSAYQISPEARDYINGIQRDALFYPFAEDGDLFGPDFQAGSTTDQTGINWPWLDNATVIDGHKATEYLEDTGQVRFDEPQHKPWRRTSIALNLHDGQEYRFDSDSDGHPEHIPFLSVGLRSGNQYPPLLMPDKDMNSNQILYKVNYSKYAGPWSKWGIPRANVMGWHSAAPQYFHLTDAEFAVDEPIALSGSGNVIFANLCCDRVGWWSHLTKFQSGTLWDYGRTLESLGPRFASPEHIQPWERSLAPAYDEMWWESSMWSGLPRLYGGYGNRNAIYHNHGLQNPIIPYEGKLFVHRSNAIIAMGANPPALPAGTDLPSLPSDPNYPPTVADHTAYEAAVIATKKRPLLKFDRQKRDIGWTITTAELKQRLEIEVQKMIDTGHLRPGYYSIGQHGYPQFINYFENPGDTLLTLTLAYPHLSTELQQQLRSYLEDEFDHYFKNDMIARIGWYEDPVDPDFGQLQGREAMPLPVEVAESLKSQPHDSWAGQDWPWLYPQHNLYALWQYAQLEPDKASEIYQLAKSKLELNTPSDDRLQDNPWENNAYIAGYIGFLQLQALVAQDDIDNTLRTQVEAQLQYLLNLRVTTFDKDQPWVGDRLVDAPGGYIHRRNMSIARNFLYMTPELADHLRTHILVEVEEAIDEYNWVAPYWFATRYEASVSEGVQRHLYDSPALFLSKAYILQENQNDLVKYLDVAAFAVGDLFYIQNLIAAIEAPSSTGEPAVVSFTLIDADTNRYLSTLSDGDTINLATLPTTHLNIRANLQPATVGSVKFSLNDNPNHYIDNQPPYAVFGDIAGDYIGWTPTVGQYTLTASPYNEAEGNGTLHLALTIQFQVINEIVDQPTILPTYLPVVTNGYNQETGQPATPTPPPPGDSGPVVGIATNKSGYPLNQIPLYAKVELEFEVDTSATNLQWPYDPAPPAGIQPHVGISVDGLFSPDGWETVYTQPAFLYQGFQHEIKEGQDWIYPTGQFTWRIRFTPNQTGTWHYKILAQDEAGSYETAPQAFTVISSTNKGFVKVSQADKRYFEFDDGTLFSGQGYNLTYGQVDWNNPTVTMPARFATLQNHGLQLFRTWLSHWGIFSSAWGAWNSPLPGYHSQYIPSEGLSTTYAYLDHDVSMKLSWNDNPAMFLGFQKLGSAVKQNTTYYLSIRYLIPKPLAGPRIASHAYGLVAKTGSWLTGDGSWPANIDGFSNPGTGTIVSDYAFSSPVDNGQPQWAILEGEIQTTNEHFLPFFYLTLENVTIAPGNAQFGDDVYIDLVEIREDLGNGNYGPNLISKPVMGQHRYFDQRFAYAFDHILTLAEAHDLYLKLVVLEKNEWIMNRIDYTGNMIDDDGRCWDEDPENDPAKCPDNQWFYGNGRQLSKVRWLQQTWWRYLQARWGYSPHIHSWELLNEGDPWHEAHYILADEFGRYMHQFQPNDHLVTTSFWHSFPNDDFWNNPAYPHLDYADIHAYATESTDIVADVLSYSEQYGANAPDGSGIPLIRGETGFNDAVLQDRDGIWLHNYIWANLNGGGMLDQYWYGESHIEQPTTGNDLRYHYRPYLNFISTLALNNGHFEPATVTVSNSQLRAFGQINRTDGCAHLWVQNKTHTWRNVVDNHPMPSQSGRITIANFEPNSSYTVEWWDTYQPDKQTQILRREAIDAQPNGMFVIDVNNLASDIALKIKSISGCQ